MLFASPKINSALKIRHLDDNLVAKNYKSSGVKKIIILGIMAHTQENFDNICMLWSLLKINEFYATIATDLKLANILTETMAHSSTCPCT